MPRVVLDSQNCSGQALYGTYGSIAGIVFEDLNNDGIKDAGESGISGVTVKLFNSSNVQVGSNFVTTDGTYSFTNLAPDTYYVKETQPSSYGDGKDSRNGSPIPENNDTIDQLIVTSNGNLVNNNFGELKGARVSGYVYKDVNLDDKYNPDVSNGFVNTPIGISGVTLNLYLATDTNFTNPIQTKTTDSNGYYEFVGINIGNSSVNYIIKETQPSGYFDGDESIGLTPTSTANTNNSLLDKIPVTLTTDDNKPDYNFGEIVAGSIAGRVYIDANANDFYDTGETAIAAVTVKLYDSTNTQIGVTTTDNNGQYLFPNLIPGNYTVKESQPFNYTDGGESIGNTVQLQPPAINDAIATSIVSGEPKVEHNFGEVVPVTPPTSGGTIEGYVYVANSQIWGLGGYMFGSLFFWRCLKVGCALSYICSILRNITF